MNTMNIILTCLLCLFLLAGLSQVARKASAANLMSEGIPELLAGIAVLVKPAWFAENVWGDWVLDWYIVLGVALILLGSIELVRGIVQLSKHNGETEE